MAEWFTAPVQTNHRRYEALRALFVDGLTHAQAAQRFGYTRWTMVDHSSSSPRWRNASMNGTSGPKCPTIAEDVTSTRTVTDSTAAGPEHRPDRPAA